jgi:hypothetical protein
MNIQVRSRKSPNVKKTQEAIPRHSENVNVICFSMDGRIGAVLVRCQQIFKINVDSSGDPWSTTVMANITDAIPVLRAACLVFEQAGNTTLVLATNELIREVQDEAMLEAKRVKREESIRRAHKCCRECGGPFVRLGLSGTDGVYHKLDCSMRAHGAEGVQ